MKLYFLRHGIAEDMAASDFARELTPRGRRRVAQSADVMRRLNLRPQRIYSSPRLRACQTAEIVAAALDRPLILAEQVNFGFDLDDVSELTADLQDSAEVMFVGHNPDMSLLVHQLTGVNVSMKKGGLARVDVIDNAVSHGELVWLIAPKVFDVLAANSAPQTAEPAQSAPVTPPQKLPTSPHTLQTLIQHRWSPLGFDRERGIHSATLLSILEAGRWAASSSNLQPWRFIVARRENQAEFNKLLSVIREGNQPWARHAAVLMIAVAHKFRGPGVSNRHAGYDLGQAVAQMVLQALDHGVYVHQMGGFFPDKARDTYHIPEEYEPYTAIAMAYRSSDLNHLGDGHRQREAAQRERQRLADLVFSGVWKRPAEFLPQ